MEKVYVVLDWLDGVCCATTNRMQAIKECIKKGEGGKIKKYTNGKLIMTVSCETILRRQSKKQTLILPGIDFHEMVRASIEGNYFRTGSWKVRIEKSSHARDTKISIGVWDEDYTIIFFLSSNNYIKSMFDPEHLRGLLVTNKYEINNKSSINSPYKCGTIIIHNAVAV